MKIPYAKLVSAIRKRETSLDNPGFCLSCGEEQEGCEPDALGYTCDYCGEPRVYGAEEILLRGEFE